LIAIATSQLAREIVSRRFDRKRVEPVAARVVAQCAEPNPVGAGWYRVREVSYRPALPPRTGDHRERGETAIGSLLLRLAARREQLGSSQQQQ